jgi:hypothetical protein
MANVSPDLCARGPETSSCTGPPPLGLAEDRLAPKRLLATPLPLSLGRGFNRLDQTPDLARYCSGERCSKQGKGARVSASGSSKP